MTMGPSAGQSAPEVPLTQSQSLIWTGQALAPDAPLYNMAWRFDFGTAIDPQRFVQAFRHAALDSDAMRMVFAGGADGPRARVLPNVPVLPEIVDLSGKADPAAAATTWIADRTPRRLDLGSAAHDTALLHLGSGQWTWFLNLHHLITDAFSTQLFFTSVSEAYAALGTGEALDPGAGPGFAIRHAIEAEERGGPVQSAAAAHWSNLAAEAHPASPPYGQTEGRGHGQSVRVGGPLGAARSAALRALAGTTPFRLLNPDLSLFVLFATAYVAYLARVTGDRQITLAAPAHNRPSAVDRATQGLFIEMFPLRVTVEDADTFQSLHARVAKAAFDWLRHARPGASTAEAVSLASAVLNYIPVRFGDFDGAPAQVTWLHPGAHDPGHDLRLHVTDFGASGDLEAWFDVKIAGLDAPQRQAIPGHFKAVLDALSESPDMSLWAPALAQPGEAVADVSGPKSGPAMDVVAALAETVHRDPSGLAVRHGDITLDYQTFAARTDAVAGGLIEAGVRPGDQVLVFGRRSIDLLVAIWATLKAGAAFVPIPADTPAARLDQIAGIAAPRLVLAGSEQRAAAEALGLPVLDLEDLPTGPAPASDPAPDLPAYTIFTSGTTGMPKGVTVTRGAFGGYIAWAARSYTSPGRADFAVCSSIGFDLTLTSMFVPAVAGGAAIIYPETGLGTDLAILDVFAEDRAHVVKLTPSHLSLVCEAGRPVRTIGTLILGGEALTSELCRRAEDGLSPNLRIFNEYGPTEAVVGCMIHRFDRDSDLRETVPIGQPADDVRLSVLDPSGDPAPAGVTGEIFIGGSRLATGYLGQPALTAKRFAANPVPGAGRMYRTGDLARMLPSGSLEYLGRSDTQIKLSGVRIEPAEIEAALMLIPGVTGAVARLFTPGKQTAASAGSCARCGLSAAHPDCSLGPDGICSICAQFDTYQDRAQVYFDTPDALRDKIAGLAARRSGDYDVIVLLSGGKDSTYALYRMRELTPRILALTLDNGFISEGAKANIRRTTAALGVAHRFMATEAMNAIFVDSLKRHSNVCNGCFKAIYTLALQVAMAEGVPAILTGLSRGQFFETRLTPDLFVTQAPSRAEIDRTVARAREAYHQTPDVVTESLGAPISALKEVEFIDIYRYLDVPLTEIYSFLADHAPWIRPEDTGRSTNCLINDVGIYVHKRREGFHNYALPYSWDVRMGHKTRTEAVDELNDAIDPRKVQDILDQIGFDEDLSRPAEAPRLVAWIVADGVTPKAVRAALADTLPRAMRPSDIIAVDAIPLTSNGKVDMAGLPAPRRDRPAGVGARVAPASPAERALAQIWEEILNVSGIGMDDNFYDLGGDSIAAIRIAARGGSAELRIDATDIFEHQTIRALAAVATARAEPAPAARAPRKPLVELGAGDLAALSKALGKNA